MSTTEIVWFRRDLRVHDHPALTAAARGADRVVPVFVLDDALLRGRFASAPRTAFLLGCLHELRAALRDRGANLVIRRGRPEHELAELARETNATAVRFAADVSPFATARDERVEDALREQGVEPIRHDGTFVTDLSTKPYAVFSPFHRAWTQLPRREIHGAPRSLTLPSGLAVGDIPRAELGLEDPIEPGEKAARARMHAFVRDGLEQYTERHDRLEGGTSELSPYLHFGCLSPRELEEKARASSAFTRQLAWRDFYAQVLLHNPRNARHAHQPEMDGLEWEDDEEGFAAWCDGRTGFPVVDAGMRQLKARGWMHNRARLITACFLVKDLHIDWRRGEEHFMRLLLDGDEANNNGNWQWVSSVGVDPAPYFRRMYNPAAQQERHDPTGEYVRRWVPELDTDDYPEPIVDHKLERERAMARYRAAKQS
jgi:deoxyribodipyrimidine photo-lyase